jgi:hypothetical protein
MAKQMREADADYQGIDFRYPQTIGRDLRKCPAAPLTTRTGCLIRCKDA